jgi:hypothetical protein
MPAATPAVSAAFFRSAQKRHSVADGGTSRPHSGQIQLNILLAY